MNCCVSFYDDPMLCVSIWMYNSRRLNVILFNISANDMPIVLLVLLRIDFRGFLFWKDF